MFGLESKSLAGTWGTPPRPKRTTFLRRHSRSAEFYTSRCKK